MRNITIVSVCIAHTLFLALIRNSIGFLPNSTACPRNGMEDSMCGGRRYTMKKKYNWINCITLSEYRLYHEARAEGTKFCKSIIDRIAKGYN